MLLLQKSHNQSLVDGSDEIETKLVSIGLRLPEPLKLPPSIQTPFTWVRIRGNQAYISGMKWI